MPAWAGSLNNQMNTPEGSVPTSTMGTAQKFQHNNPGNCLTVNHPQLLTKVKTEILRLSFLKRCRHLKRPPQSLRLKHISVVSMKTFICVASSAETEILKSEIRDKQRCINNIKSNIRLSDPSLLHKVNERVCRNLQQALDRKYNWLKSQDETCWIDWPSKVVSSDPKQTMTLTPSPSKKKSCNAASKLRRAHNRIIGLSKAALDNGSVVNLTSRDIPPEAIVVLAKRLGFVPTATHDHLQSRIDVNAAMAKLCSMTEKFYRDSNNGMDVIDPSTAKQEIEGDNAEDEDDEDEIPDFLRLKKPWVAQNCGDPVVDNVKDNLMATVDLLKPKTLKSNLSALERKGLTWVQNEVKKGLLQFVKADKGGALCIIDRSVMRQWEADKLNNSEVFECLGENDPTEDMYTQLLDLWREGEESGFVSRNTSYTVVGKGGWWCSGAGGVVVSFSAPEQEDQFCSDLVKDSTEALRWLESHKDLAGRSVNGFAWDFSSLYDNLTPQLVMEALLVAIHELRPDWSAEFIKWIMDLVNLNLTSSVGKFGNLWYRNKVGVVTGGSLSVSLANIAVFYALRRVMEDSISAHLLGFKRFLDDIMGLWTGSKDEFIVWADSVNNLLGKWGLSIKDNKDEDWQFSPPSDYCVFLDIRFRFDILEGLLTDVNIKSTDARVYLHFSSFHPRNTFKSIVYSQCLRYRRIINDDIKLHRRLQELKDCFVRSGYPVTLVEGVIKDVVSRQRNLTYKPKDKSPPNRILWIQTYGPATQAITDAVKEANNILTTSPAWEGDSKVIGVVNRRPRNLGDLVLKRKKLALDTSMFHSGTTRCTPFPEPGVKRRPGRPCASCDLMSESTSISSSMTGRIYSTPSADCKSKNSIYCATCLHCHKQYVGKSTNKLQKRISGHRAHMNDTVFDPDNDDATLAEHLKLVHGVMDGELFNHSYNFTVLQLSPQDLDACEQRWVDRLTTLVPFGLNKEAPNGVSSSFASMCRKSLGLSQRKE
ncbi:hypothetical protein ACHWQZ_G012763 [Mnemiopsis leidyi]